MANFGRILFRETLKKQYKLLKKEHKDLKGMTFNQFKKQYDQIVAQTHQKTAPQISDTEENLDEMLVDVEEVDEQKDPIAE